ncbi:hypothetical protein EI94DRAFT_1211335 [Lactarius quietus]|nr:hypothetical protein EI94DRAFT_1211335 [Lactarius quietus]
MAQQLTAPWDHRRTPEEDRGLCRASCSGLGELVRKHAQRVTQRHKSSSFLCNSSLLMLSQMPICESRHAESRHVDGEAQKHPAVTIEQTVGCTTRSSRSTAASIPFNDRYSHCVNRAFNMRQNNESTIEEQETHLCRLHSQPHLCPHLLRLTLLDAETVHHQSK